MFMVLRSALLCTAATMAFVLPANAGFKTLVTLKGSNGYDVGPPMIQGSDGDIYGTTDYGGPNDEGVIYRLTPNGKYKVIYDFCSQNDCTDGATGEWLTQGSDGNFYGQTLAGGNAGQGTIFEITPGGKFTSLYSYCQQQNCTDGAFPVSPLLQVSDGSFRGTTGEGGANNKGTIFKFVPGSAPQILYSFCAQAGCSDGASPFSGLVLASDGNFYGETSEGGSDGTYCGLSGYGCGTIFRLTPSGKFTTIYTFCTQSGCKDGALPQGQLIQAKDGNIYGTTDAGGAEQYGGYGQGTVFRISLKGKLTTVYTFCPGESCTDGDTPYAGVIQATDGNFYGTTALGGPNAWGAVYRLTPKGQETVIYSVNQADGEDIGASLLQASNGMLYGGTIEGGGTSCGNDSGCGVIFRGPLKGGK